MNGYCEIHSHWLYGLDDGAKYEWQMQVMLDAAFSDGITTLYATPHLMPGIREWDVKLMEQHLVEAKQYCRDMHYDMHLLSGAEVMWTPICGQWVQDHRLLTLQDSKKILIEFLPDTSFGNIEGALEALERGGYQPIIAHVERYECLHGESMRKLQENHAVEFQLNCNTLFTEHFFLRRRVAKWLKEGLIQHVASDAHNCTSRPFGMTNAYKWLKRNFDQDVADEMTGRGVSFNLSEIK